MKYLWLLLTLILGGCTRYYEAVRANFVPFSEPQDGDRARVRVVSDDHIRAIPNATCVGWSDEKSGVIMQQKPWGLTITLGPEGYRERDLNIPDPGNNKLRKESRYAEFYVRANEPLIVAQEAYCRINLGFTPKKNHDYEIIMNSTQRGNNFYCTATASDVSNNTVIPLDIKDMEFCPVSLIPKKETDGHKPNSG